LAAVAALSAVVVMVAAVAVVAMLRGIGTNAEPHSIEILSDPKYTGNMAPLV
jgi:hypothetical protein